MDPWHHPDLEWLGRRMRRRLDETLDAEQAAAHAAVRRRRTLRDVLLEAEDRGDAVVAVTIDGQQLIGRIDAVGADHVLIVDDRRSVYVAVEHLVSLEVR